MAFHILDMQKIFYSLVDEIHLTDLWQTINYNYNLKKPIYYVVLVYFLDVHNTCGKGLPSKNDLKRTSDLSGCEKGAS